jgi:Aldehyde dehydrogenase family
MAIGKAVSGRPARFVLSLSAVADRACAAGAAAATAWEDPSGLNAVIVHPAGTPPGLSGPGDEPVAEVTGEDSAAFTEGPASGGVMHFDDRWAPEGKLHWLQYFQVADTEASLALAAGLVFTGDLRAAHRFAEDVQAGYVWVNEVSRHVLGVPFGGVKNSGLGREEDLEELYSYTEPKNVHVNFDA